jgi:mediator of RNA polymerase II transcription subunit 20
MLYELDCHAHSHLLLLLKFAGELVLILFLLYMQVEYYPLSSIEKSRAIMEDFFDVWQETVAKKSLPGHFIHVESNFSEYGLSDQYSFQHTAVQYATCLQQLMASGRG